MLSSHSELIESQPDSPPVEEFDSPQERDDVIAVALPPQSDADLLPVVGLGGSAGSISALQTFFSRIPANSGMVFVVVLHLSPDHESALTQVLQARTSMPVTQVTGAIKVEVDHVYVIPPGQHLTMTDGTINLSEPQQPRGKRVAVDLFFRTLASTHRSKAVAVVLSGADGDGSIGVKRIKEFGGLTIAQDPDEAEVDNMPRSAIETGMVDWILPVQTIADKLSEWIQNERRIQMPAEVPQTTSQTPNEKKDDEDERALREVLAFLLARTGHDFSHYKRATVLRRIMRRLQVNSLENVPQYEKFLRTHPGEAGALLQDLLISVTNFFRDAEAFRALNAHIPSLFRGKKEGDIVRIWVPGCATGEEAYSLAIAICEHTETLDPIPEFQIFATDLDEMALRQAREGFYPATIIADVSPERLRRFFVHDQGHYRVNKNLRERILFAPHNLLKDSPFSRLDLISCRNLLIYFGREAQEHVFEVFHFALRPDALLFLGGSESADDNPLFAPIDKKNRIYQRQSVSRPHIAPLLAMPQLPPLLEIPNIPHLTPTSLSPPPSLSRRDLGDGGPSFAELHLKLLEQSAPPSVLVDTQYEIVHLSEHAGRYLRLAGGQISTNFLSVIPPLLRIPLRTALFRALQNGEDVDVPTLSVEIDGQAQRLSIRVRPLRQDSRTDGSSTFALVIFDEAHPLEGETPAPPIEPDDESRRLDEELQHLKSYLRTSVEQYETSCEELKASNEELQAMNEEQRSATEELETSREEIQSVNEELITVNQELKGKIEELSRSNSDLQNLMSASSVATLFLTRDLRIKRYTPPASEIFRIIASDIGRPLGDLRHHFVNESFIEDANQVIRNLTVSEREIETADGRTFLLRVAPYRTVDDRIDGVVLTFVDITNHKASQEALRLSEDRYRALFDSMGEAFALCEVITDENGRPHDLRMLDANRAQEELLKVPVGQATGHTLRELIPGTQDWWFEVLGQVAFENEGKRFESYVPGLDRWLSVSGYPVDSGKDGRLALISTDITERKRGEEALRASEAAFRIISNAAPALVWVTAADGENIFFNERWYEFTGQSLADSRRTGWLKVTHPDDVARLLPYWERCRQTGEIYEGENRYRRHDGEYRWHAFRALPRRDENNQIEAWYGVSIDIHDTKIAQEALQESESRFRAIINQATVGITQCDGTGRFLLVNDRLCEIVGYSRQEMLQMSFFDITHPDDRAENQEKYARMMAQGTPFETEKRCLHKDGSIVWSRVSVGAVRDAAGITQSGCAIVVDVTQQREAELAQRESEEQRRIAVEAANLGTCDWHYQTGQLYWNDQHYRLLGLEPRQGAFTQEEFMACIYPPDLEDLQEKFRIGIEELGNYEVEFRIVRQDDGEVRWMNDSGRVVARDENGFPTRVGNVIFDVTVRREAEEALKRAHDQLEFRVGERTQELASALRDLQAEVKERQKAEVGRDNLLRQIVHAQEDERRRISRELHDNMGQHLTAILLAIQAVETQNQALAFEDRRAVGGNLAKLRGMVDELLSVSHRLAWELRPAVLDSIGLKAALEQYVANWSEKTGIEADFESHLLDDDNTPLSTDAETALFRVAQETLTNVQRHSEATLVSVVLDQNETSVGVIIEDNGIGMDLSNGDYSTRLGVMGMRERLELVGGTLTLESGEGAGLTVYARVAWSRP